MYVYVMCMCACIYICYMGGCQNYGPLLGPDYNTAPIIQSAPKGTIILTTTLFIHVGLGSSV